MNSFSLATVKAFLVQGLTIFFNPNDHHPPHFHVKKKGAWEIRIRFLTCTEDYLDFEYKFPKNPKKGLSSQEEQELLSCVLKNRTFLLEEWEAKVVVKENLKSNG